MTLTTKINTNIYAMIHRKMDEFDQEKNTNMDGPTEDGHSFIEQFPRKINQNSV